MFKKGGISALDYCNYYYAHKYISESSVYQRGTSHTSTSDEQVTR